MAYAAVASAAGVGMFASPQAAEAKIVYTPGNTNISDGNGVALDLNHDGIVDFNLIHWGAASVGGSLRISYMVVCHDALVNFSHQCVSSTNDSNAANVVKVTASGAAALPFGAPIGPGGKFGGSGVRVVMGGRDFYSRSPNTAQKWYGPWVNGGAGVTNRYLGLKFKIAGKWHFGWAGVATTPKNGFSVTLTGYAYETIPNQRIRAGQTSGGAETSSMNQIDPIIPANAVDGPSLGSLALGAAGPSIWRRENG